jgi:acyl-coenzyme A thioesterase PaaI-like protein
MKPLVLRKKKKFVTVARRRGASFRMGDTRDYRMATIDSVLRRSLDARSAELILTLDPAFQGLPDTAHGGSVLAAFDALAGLEGPREVSGVYRRRVPLGVPLRLAHACTETTHTFVLRDTTSVLVDARVWPAADGACGARGALLDHASNQPDVGRVTSIAPGDAQKLRVSEGTPRPAAHPLPVSRTCFACGVDNPLGLRVQLEFDDAEVRGTWQPREPFRTANGALTTAALTTLCDEAAFWLGALATGESGMTTELAVTLHRAVPFGGPLTVTGARTATRPRPDPRYWDTEVLVRTEDRTLVASARITFVAVRGAARRLVQGLFAMNDPALVARVFPAYAR